MANIIQADRDAVAAFHRASVGLLMALPKADVNGAHELLCQAIAAHRLAHQPAAAQESVEAVKYALDGVIAAFPSYRARNGKSVSLQADDGEKCWIIHDDVRNDAIQAKAALAALPDTAALVAEAWHEGYALGELKWAEAMNSQIGIEEALRAQLTATRAVGAKLAEQVEGVIAATQAYLPPDGTDEQTCINAVLEATDNPEALTEWKALGDD